MAPLPSPKIYYSIILRWKQARYKRKFSLVVCFSVTAYIILSYLLLISVSKYIFCLFLHFWTWAFITGERVDINGMRLDRMRLKIRYIFPKWQFLDIFKKVIHCLMNCRIFIFPYIAFILINKYILIIIE